MRRNTARPCAPRLRIYAKVIAELRGGYKGEIIDMPRIPLTRKARPEMLGTAERFVEIERQSQSLPSYF